jgi:hypothetical protein
MGPGIESVCKDGWYSESSGSGTCSHHGGIKFRALELDTLAKHPAPPDSFYDYLTRGDGIEGFGIFIIPGFLVFLGLAHLLDGRKTVRPNVRLEGHRMRLKEAPLPKDHPLLNRFYETDPKLLKGPIEKAEQQKQNQNQPEPDKKPGDMERAKEKYNEELQQAPYVYRKGGREALRKCLEEQQQEKDFTPKPRVKMWDFCWDFYDRCMLDPVGGLQINASLCNAVRNRVLELDRSFASVSIDSLLREVVPLRFEMFGLAWLHGVGIKQAVSQTVFTMDHLSWHNPSDIWLRMTPYNKAIERSSNFTSSTMLDRYNAERVQWYTEWTSQGYDSDCAARVTARMFAEEALEQNVTHVCLVQALCEQLGCPPLDQGAIHLAVMVDGFYCGAREALDKVTIADDEPFYGSRAFIEPTYTLIPPS